MCLFEGCHLAGIIYLLLLSDSYRCDDSYPIIRMALSLMLLLFLLLLLFLMLLLTLCLLLLLLLMLLLMFGRES